MYQQRSAGVPAEKYLAGSPKTTSTTQGTHTTNKTRVYQLRGVILDPLLIPGTLGACTPNKALRTLSPLWIARVIEQIRKGKVRMK